MSYRTTLPPLDLDLDLEALEKAVALTRRERLVRCVDRATVRGRRGWRDLVLVSVLTLVAGLVHARGMYRSPARFDDEGTYTAYAWAVPNMHKLSHYTYWYAHPPLGQLQMAAWNVLTDAFARLPYAVATGRELSFVYKLVAVILTYVLARRLGYLRVTASIAVVLFSLSPLAVYFQRTALLDNLVTPWLLGSFALAASPRRSMSAAAGSAVCFAVAVLTKETALLFLPALLVVFWQHSDRRNRRFTTVMLLGVMMLIGLFYPLYALIKHELLTGPGHVSLQWAITWQLSGREGSGSVFDPGSTAHAVAHSWVVQDPISCVVAVACVVPGLVLRRTRGVALALAVQLGSLLRNGYLPYPFVVAMIPFAALTVAGVLDALLRLGGLRPTSWRGAVPLALRHTAAHPWRMTVAWLAVASIVVFTVLAWSPWRRGLTDLWTRDSDAGKASALAFLRSTATPNDVLVVDDAFWVDLVRSGHPRAKVIWFTKLDVDRDVKLPGRQPWRDIDYILIDQQDALSVHLNADWTPSKDTELLYPTLGRALAHSSAVASFGTGLNRATVFRVHGGTARKAVPAVSRAPGRRP
jgi:hypothetical protein